MSSEIAVQCRGVQKEFGNGAGKVLALRGVDLDVRYGEMTLLVGPSGCGKTTLLSVIAGLLNTSAGEVRVLGEQIERLPGRQQILFRRKNLGFVFQQYNLLPALTAAENGAVPLLAAGVPRRQAVKEAERLLTTLGMGNRLNALPKKLSGGEQQRVALTRALIHQPRLLVCDEPTAALDADTGHAVMELLAAEAVRPERAVIVVTHDNRIFSFADTIARMDDGRILGVDSEVRTQSKVEFVPPQRVREEVFA
ncbi:MAG TPA: ABC transporter ATP-binding protein [Pyrinomonadaceae bacterium]|jgi:putative ABC transport system ATP-binding protein